MSRVVKKELWRLFDAGHTFDGLEIPGLGKIDPAALEKQRQLHAEFRIRNPKRKKNEVQKIRAVAA